MKEFASLKELISYCALCPQCQGERELDFGVFPDEFLYPTSSKSNRVSAKYLGYNEDETLFNIIIAAQYEYQAYDLAFKVDPTTNQIVECLLVPELKIEGQELTELEPPYFSFDVYGRCKNSCSSTVQSAEVLIDIRNKEVKSLGIETETIHINDYDHTHDVLYTVKQDYASSATLVHRDVYAGGVDTLRLELIDLPFSNYTELLRRIELLFAYS